MSIKSGVILLGVILLAAAAWWWKDRPAKEVGNLWVHPKKGLFEVTVTATGELQAKRSVDITGPDNLRKARIWQLKIQSLLPEGTVVKAGDQVAELDKSELVGKIKEAEIALSKASAQYTQAKLDCTLTLSQAREDIVNQRFALEENRLKKEQSRFEAPAVIRQTEIEYEKAQRQLKQSQNNYVTKVNQAKAKMEEVNAEVQKQDNEYKDLRSLMKEFSIKAPENGMVIYKKQWNGKKVVQGDQISTWEPTVATLPDLSEMESVAYINEIDIQKIKDGQTVRIGLDADPKKKLTGTISFKANIGEQKPGSESKVFEVKITVNEKDTTLRPAMTTSNQVLVEKIENALHIPLECVRAEGKKNYVQVKNANGSEKREVELGSMNDNEVIILKGLTEQDEVMLSQPTDTDKKKDKDNDNGDNKASTDTPISSLLIFFAINFYGFTSFAEYQRRSRGISSK